MIVFSQIQIKAVVTSESKQRLSSTFGKRDMVRAIHHQAKDRTLTMIHRTPIYLSSILFFLSCFFLIRCGSTTQSQPGDQSKPSASEQEETQNSNTFRSISLEKNLEITYLFQWNWQEATWNESLQEYHFQNNLKYSFGIQSGYLSTISVQMVPCQTDEYLEEKIEEMRKFGILFPIQFRIPSALADHAYEDDTSLKAKAVIEHLYHKKNLEFGVGKTSGKDYCKVHVLHTALSRNAENGVQIQNKSAQIKGWYRLPNSPKKIPFDISTTLPSGELLSLELLPTHQPPIPYQTQAALLLIRNPVKAFHGLDPSQLSPLDFAFRFLQNVGKHSRALIDLNAQKQYQP